MKAILEFTLPDERAEHRLAIDGWKWRCVVEGLDSYLRDWLKYRDGGADVEAVRKDLFDLLDEYNLTLDEE